MKYIEILLKVWFLASAVALFIVRDSSCLMKSLAASSILLGITLIFNKNHSYGWYKISHREVTIRRIEGIVLIMFGTVVATMACGRF